MLCVQCGLSCGFVLTVLHTVAHHVLLYYHTLIRSMVSWELYEQVHCGQLGM